MSTRLRGSPGDANAPVYQHQGDAVEEPGGPTSAAHPTSIPQQEHRPAEAPPAVPLSGRGALPAVRTARAGALLQVIDKTDSDVIDYEVLAHWMTKQYRTDSGWTPAQLEQAVNDLADAGEVAVAPGGYQSHLAVERLRVGRMPS